jgi:uncharacterized linocin/CFP29 family protein
MDRNSADLGWTDEQWSRASKAVQQEAQRARVAGQFLPSFNQPDVTAVAVPRRLIDYHASGRPDPAERIRIDNTPSIFLTSLAVNISLSSQEAADPEQSAALIELRRAANLIARLEDALVFRGQPGPDDDPPGVAQLPQVYSVTGGANQPGLFNGGTVTVPVAGNAPGETVAAAIIEAIGQLEERGHNRPFACVLGHTYYTALHTPTNAMILPRDRVVPFLEGPLLRSSTLPGDGGVVVALGGSPIELVVSSELHLRFLQITTDPAFVLRVSERIALRVTEWSSVAVLQPAP